MIWLGKLERCICRLNGELGLFSELLFFNSSYNVRDFFSFEAQETSCDQLELLINRKKINVPFGSKEMHFCDY